VSHISTETSLSPSTRETRAIAELIGRPLVSVVIPCHNHARFVGEAIESAMAQTWRPIEIVVINDGSTDGTAAVLDRYPRVMRIDQQKKGLAAARNVGIGASHGDYLVFLDADDTLLPGAIEAGVNALLPHVDCAFAAGAHRRVDGAGRSLGGPVVPRPSGDAYAALLRRNYIEMHAAVVYRRAMIERVGGFDASLQACEDYDLYLKLTRRFPICHHNQIVSLYRQHADNMSRDATLMARTYLNVLERQRRHVRESPERSVAYRDGVRFWRDFYATRLLAQSLKSFRRGNWRQLLRDIVVLCHYAPATPISWGRQKLGTVVLKARRHCAKVLRDSFLSRTPPFVCFGSLKRVTPIGAAFGFERGRPVDRFYIESFLDRHRGEIKGRVLEIGDDAYTRRFGGDRVERVDVLNVNDGKPGSTIIGDLAQGEGFPEHTFDCIIFTQTLQLIYDSRAALGALHRMLKPGGIILATMPGVSSIDRGEWREQWCWSFTVPSATRLFREFFTTSNVSVESHGNVFAAISFLHGLCCEELSLDSLAYVDECYPVIIAVGARKALT
jgi:glycosyltransferase involved in cell wall biosynthesis/SAM-dependent methyltransferase